MTQSGIAVYGFVHDLHASKLLHGRLGHPVVLHSLKGEWSLKALLGSEVPETLNHKHSHRA